MDDKICPCVQCRSVREVRRMDAIMRTARAVSNEAGDLAKVQSRAVIIPTELLRDLRAALEEAT